MGFSDDGADAEVRSPLLLPNKTPVAAGPIWKAQGEGALSPLRRHKLQQEALPDHHADISFFDAASIYSSCTFPTDKEAEVQSATSGTVKVSWIHIHTLNLPPCVFVNFPRSTVFL